MLAPCDVDVGDARGPDEHGYGLGGVVGVPYVKVSLWKGKNRSRKLMAFLRQKKQTNRHEQVARHVKSDLNIVATSSNRLHGLRFGDRVHDHGAHKARSSAKERKPHPKQWSVDGWTRAALNALGSKATPHVKRAIGETRRKLAAISATASIFRIAQAQVLKDFSELAKAARAKSIMVSAHYDATPMMVAFGVQRGRVWARAR